MSGDATREVRLRLERMAGAANEAEIRWLIGEWLTEIAAAPAPAESVDIEGAFIVWLVETLHYPFDFSFSTPPPVDHGRLADYWNESDGWKVTPEEARSVVHEEAGIGGDA